MSNFLEVILNLIDNLSPGMADAADSVQLVTSAVNDANSSEEELATSADTANNAVESISNEDITAVSEAASTASADLTDVQTAAGEADTAISGIDEATINEAASAATTLGSDLSNVDVGAKTVDGALESISPATLSEVSNSAQSASSNIAETASKVSETASEMENASSAGDLLSGVLAGLVTMGVSSWFSDIVNAAGDYQESWERLAIAVGEGGTAISTVQGEWTGAISTMTNETGRGAGIVRNYIIEMANAGVTSQSTLESAFTGISGAAFETGSSIDTIESAFKRVVTTGTFSARQLVTLGLTTQDVQKATGLSVDEVSAKLKNMDPTARAAYLSMILNAKYGEAANEAYKNSWQRVTDKVNLAYQYLMRIIGGLLLPLAIPAVNTMSSALSGVASWIDHASGTTKTFLGVVLGGVGGIVAITAVIATLRAGMNLLGITQILTSARTGIATIANWANALSFYGSSAAMDTAAGAAAAHAGAVVMDTAAQEGGLIARITSTAATVAGTAANIAHASAIYVVETAQWLWNAALDANPIGIVVIAVIALVAVLAYLYNKNETVRNAVNALWSGLQALGGYIMGGLMAAWNGLKTALSPITDALGNLWAAISKVWSSFAGGKAAQANSTFTKLGNAVKALWAIISGALMPVFRTWYTILVQVGTFVGGFFSAAWKTISGSIMAVINYVALFINTLAQLISGQITFSQFATIIWNGFKAMLLGILTSVISGVGTWASRLITKGRNAAMGFVNNILNYIKSLPGRIWAYLMYTLQRIQNFANSARERARSAGSQIVSGLRNAVSQAPGAVYTELSRIVGRMLSIGGTLYNTARNLGSNIVNSLKAGLGIASPGHMYWAMHDELDRIVDVFGTKESALIDAASALGSSISDSFKSSASADVDIAGNIIGTGRTRAVGSDDGSSSTTKTENTLILDFRNIPDSVDESNFVDKVIKVLKRRDVGEVIDVTLGKVGSKTRASAGR